MIKVKSTANDKNDLYALRDSFYLDLNLDLKIQGALD